MPFRIQNNVTNLSCSSKWKTGFASPTTSGQSPAALKDGYDITSREYTGLSHQCGINKSAALL